MAYITGFHHVVNPFDGLQLANCDGLMAVEVVTAREMVVAVTEGG